MVASLIRKILGVDAARDRVGDLGLLFDSLMEKLVHLEPEEVKRITGYAGMLGRIAYADMEISDVEIDRMKQILSTELKLSPSHVALLVSLLVEHRVQLFSVEDHFYHRIINESCSFDEKMALMKVLFGLAAADGSISKEEDAALFTASKSLRLSHRDFIAVRRQFATYLDVLKDQ